MIRGLLWLPLLAVFIGLTWAGWNEYRKVEVYKQWAAQFERAKFDIYAVLGQQGDQLTWGLPTRRGVVETETLNLRQVEQVYIEVNGQKIDLDQPPKRGRFALGFILKEGKTTSIPFTDGEIARQWFDFLAREWSLT
ncbi:MAG: hypothetical protein AAF716_16500 [Cyanobacteria bacterium P01_D01_bin.1]